jgi:hypothetical protein
MTNNFTISTAALEWCTPSVATGGTTVYATVRPADESSCSDMFYPGRKTPSLGTAATNCFVAVQHPRKLELAHVLAIDV